MASDIDQNLRSTLSDHGMVAGSDSASQVPLHVMEETRRSQYAWERMRLLDLPTVGSKSAIGDFIACSPEAEADAGGWIVHIDPKSGSGAVYKLRTQSCIPQNGIDDVPLAREVERFAEILR